MVSGEGGEERGEKTYFILWGSEDPMMSFVPEQVRAFLHLFMVF